MAHHTTAYSNNYSTDAVDGSYDGSQDNRQGYATSFTNTVYDANYNINRFADEQEAPAPRQSESHRAESDTVAASRKKMAEKMKAFDRAFKSKKSSGSRQP